MEDWSGHVDDATRASRPDQQGSRELDGAIGQAQSHPAPSGFAGIDLTEIDRDSHPRHVQFDRATPVHLGGVANRNGDLDLGRADHRSGEIDLETRAEEAGTTRGQFLGSGDHRLSVDQEDLEGRRHLLATGEHMGKPAQRREPDRDEEHAE